MFKPGSTLLRAALATLALVTLTACASTPAAAPAATTAPAKPAAAEPTKAAAPAATTAPAAASFPKMDIKLGHAVTTDTPWHKATARFADLVKERTGGNVNVQIFPNSQLGSEKDQVEQVKNGIIQMTVSSSGMVSVFEGWGPVGALGMPYVFKGNSDEEQYPTFLKVARGPIIKEMADDAAKKSGMRSLDMGWWYGTRNVTTKSKQVAKPEDIKGIKIRTVDSPIQKLAMQALGAAVTPMPFAELYSALQMGVVDGQENPINTIYVQKYYEVQKYISLTAHMTQNELVLINDKFYQGLSPELKSVLEKAAIEAGDFMSQEQLKANKQNLEDLKAKGMVVTPVNLADFAKVTENAWKEFEPSMGKGFYEKIKAAQN
ncbi:MAG TPA: TRAP transporter substrate-binding protein [Chloroflexota bacterium]|nr:TRAP transporter substrate-binding protein [Chloroflexota bacterium]